MVETTSSIEFGNLMRGVASRFCGQQCPISDEQLQARRFQQSGFSSMISGIAHAEAVTKWHALATQRIYDATRVYCESGLPSSYQEFNEFSAAGIIFCRRVEEIT